LVLRRIFYIDKEDFLLAFRDVVLNIFTEVNY
jgi:hypothetical protein